MKKTATFTDKDNELIQRIMRYKKEKKLNLFIDAVRSLCDTALKLKDISKTI